MRPSGPESDLERRIERGLAVRGLVRRYGELPAVDGIDLDVGTGEVVAILGPSGCGKTTLLRLVAGLEMADAGTVSWDGRDLAGVPPHRRDFGLMFQDHVLFPHRDVAGNVGFGLRMRGEPAARVAERVAEALELVGLAGFGDRAVSSLSGGEAQRVALARALAPEPRLLMLDEPLGSLDRVLREELVVELRSLLRRIGSTAIYVTHDHDEAFTVADRVVVMRGGRVEQAGTPEQLWRSPVSPFVARFLGWENVADGDAERTGAVAIRPDGLRLAADGAITGTVEAVTFRRDHFVVRVETEDHGTLTVLARQRPPAVAERVHVAVDADAIVTFDDRGTELPHGPRK